MAARLSAGRTRPSRFRAERTNPCQPTTMIRRDYFLRLVAEMAQVLARVLSLKGRKEYDEALREVDKALRELRDANADPAGEMSLEQWIALCRKHEQAASGLMVAVADLLKEQGDVLA